MDLQEEMLAHIRMGLAHHDHTCPLPAYAILLNPANHQLFGWDELWGIPVRADERIAAKRFRIECDGSAFGIEDELEELLTEPQPQEMAALERAPDSMPSLRCYWNFTDTAPPGSFWCLTPNSPSH